MTPTPAAWRNIRAPKVVRTEPPKPGYEQFWEPLQPMTPPLVWYGTHVGKDGTYNVWRDAVPLEKK